MMAGLLDGGHMKKVLDDWSYRNIGPTTLYLHHECYLLVSLTLLTISSLHALYRVSFGLPGDVEFVLVTALWLSRSLATRCLCAWDASTHRFPTLRGVLSHWIASHLIAGQVCDRPHPRAVANQLGLPYPSVADDSRRLLFSSASAAASPISILSASSSRLVVSVRYTWHFVRARIWYPLLCAETSASKVMENQNLVAQGTTATVMVGQSSSLNGTCASLKSRPSSTPPSGAGTGKWSAWKAAHPYLASAYSFLARLWSAYSPPLQMILLVATCIYYIRAIFFASTSSDDAIVTSKRETQPLTMNPGESPFKISEFDIVSESWHRPFGAYRPFQRPVWSDVLFYASCGGTLACIWLYARLILPMPDLVAGGNVLKSVRHEARVHGANQHSTLSGGGTSVGTSGVGLGAAAGIGVGGSGAKSSKSKIHKDQTIDLPWAEMQKSITAENRFRLVCKVISVRTMEHLFVCAFLPRTSFSCRATGHCPEGALIWTLSKLLYPAGIASTLREDSGCRSHFSMIPPDRGTALLTCASVLVVTVSLLFAQTVISQRSYLSIMGFIAGEWSIVDESDPILQTATPSQWDPRRRYKKGDLIIQNYPKRAIFKATSNSPEGRPFDLYLRATHDLFRNELGHPASSKLILITSKGQMAFLGINALFLLYYWLRGYYLGGILWTVAANVVAAFGVANVGLPNNTRLQNLAKEISLS